MQHLGLSFVRLHVLIQFFIYSALTFTLTKSSSRRGQVAEDQQTELRVAKTSQATDVAGSIAAKVRSGERVVIVAIGAAAVSISVLAVIAARRYLEADNVDIGFRPDFIEVDLKGEMRSAIRFTILAQQI